VLSNTAIFLPPTPPIENNLPSDVSAKVLSALAGNDPNVLESLANQIDGKVYPLTVAALRAKAAALRAQPNARFVSFTTKDVMVEFASPAKASSSVVVCHFVHTGGKSDLEVSGATTKRIPNRAGQWIEAGRDARYPGTATIFVAPTSTDQTWMMDRCLVTGYSSQSSAAPLSPTAAARLKLSAASSSPATATMAAPIAAGGAQGSSVAVASPAGNPTVDSSVSVSPQRPVIANRAFMSATWRGLRLPLASAVVDATRNTFSLSGTGGYGSFTLSIDVNRLVSRAEVVACNITNSGTSPLNIAGQMIAPQASQSVEVTLAPVGAPVWQTAKFAAAAISGVTVRECAIRTMAPAAPGAATPAVRRALVR
jgi:hypothetical protein